MHALSSGRSRVFICLAGPHAWKSYPLEMLLHSIRPYIVDTECADDALGMSQFLLEKGYEALSKSSSFLAGYALTSLASLRVFLETSQSSTTQESPIQSDDEQGSEVSFMVLLSIWRIMLRLPS